MASDKYINKRGRRLSLTDSDRHTVEIRVNFLKELLKSSKLEPMVDTTQRTDFFVGGYSKEGGSCDSLDTRFVLNKRIQDFENAINAIGGSLTYIKSGTTGHTFKGEAEDTNGKYQYAVKVVAYPKNNRYGSIYDVRRPENAELVMIRLLSKMVIDKATPHIVLPYTTFNTSIQTFVNLIDQQVIADECKKYKEFVSKYKKGSFYDEVSILISEWANCGDLLDFLRANYKKVSPLFWKVIFFQILAVLAVIQRAYPGFRHNDLKANNILLHKISKSTSRYSYHIDECTFKVPNIGYIIKLWDFDFSCIPGIVDNNKVESEWTKKINVSPVQNKYYDIHYFFNTIIKRGFLPEIMNDNVVPTEVREFINRVVPPKLQVPTPGIVDKKGRILTNHEFQTPINILRKDPFFSAFRSGVSKKKRIEPKNIRRLLRSETPKHPIRSRRRSKSRSKRRSRSKDKSGNRYVLASEIRAIDASEFLGGGNLV